MILYLNNQSLYTYSLYDLIAQIDNNIMFVDINNINIDEIINIEFSHIIIGSFIENNEIIKKIIDKFSVKSRILSVFDGYYSMFKYFDCKFYNSKNIEFGKSRQIHIANGTQIFKGLPPLIDVGVYNLSSIDRATLPDEVLIIAEDNNSEVMAVKHRDYNIFGIKFNIESILTENRNEIIKNFLSN